MTKVASGMCVADVCQAQVVLPKAPSVCYSLFFTLSLAWSDNHDNFGSYILRIPEALVPESLIREE